jgi:hypothetical protein
MALPGGSGCSGRISERVYIGNGLPVTLQLSAMPNGMRIYKLATNA